MGTINGTDSDKKFIMQHLNDDVVQLALTQKKYAVNDWDFVLKQIASRQRAKDKLPSWYNNEHLLFPPEISVEQSSSETTAQYKATLCTGNSLLDLTTGFGIDLLTMAPNFSIVYGVEPNSDLCNLVTANANILKITQLKQFNQTAEEFLLSESIKYVDWLYIDPSRRNAQGNRVNIELYTPDIFALKKHLFKIADKILIKLSPMLDIKMLLREFPECDKIHIVAVENECKEILLEIDTRNQITKNRIYKTINIKKRESEIFEFSADAEAEALLILGTPEEGDFLYEPNAAIMKSGGYKTITQQYKVFKIHKNSHLYISKEKIENFPGRRFQIFQIIENFRKENLKKALPQNAYNLTVRNFPESADRLKKRLKIHDGGNDFLFATTIAEEKHVLLCCRKYSEK